MVDVNTRAGHNRKCADVQGVVVLKFLPALVVLVKKGRADKSAMNTTLILTEVLQLSIACGPQKDWLWPGHAVRRSSR